MDNVHHARTMPRALKSGTAGHHKRIECPDMVALVTFHKKANILSPFVSTYEAAFFKAINALPDQIGESTNLADAIRKATDLLITAPKGLRRRVWLLTDGKDNAETDRLLPEVERANSHHININTIGFGTTGDQEFDKGRLLKVSFGTRTGRYIPVETAQRLGEVFRQDATVKDKRSHQGEATVFCIDVSPSMTYQMHNKKRIEIVRDTMYDLMRYKQKVWS